MSLFKSKNAAAGKGLYVVVQRVPGVEPETYAGPPHDREAALRVFDGVLQSAPVGFFNPQTGASMRVVPLADWSKSLLAAALLEA